LQKPQDASFVIRAIARVMYRFAVCCSLGIGTFEEH
jgi:hypothetical protein